MDNSKKTMQLALYLNRVMQKHQKQVKKKNGVSEQEFKACDISCQLKSAEGQHEVDNP